MKQVIFFMKQIILEKQYIIKFKPQFYEKIVSQKYQDYENLSRETIKQIDEYKRYNEALDYIEFLSDPQNHIDCIPD